MVIFHSSGMLWDILPEGKFLNYIKGRQGRHWDFLGVVVLISIGILPFFFFWLDQHVRKVGYGVHGCISILDYS